MDFHGKFIFYVLIVIFPTQLIFVFSSFVSKGTVENIVPFEANKTRSLFGSVGRVSKLLSVKKSNLTQNYNENDLFTSSHLKEVRNMSSFPEKLESPQTHSKIIQKRHDQERPIYNRASNAVISADSWKDLNTVFTDAEMKGFLSSLPIHLLRNLTTVTKKDPELGQKQLVRMILDRSGHLKEKLENSTLLNSKSELSDGKNADGDGDPKNKKSTTMKISGHKKNTFSSKILGVNNTIDSSNMLIPLEEASDANEIIYSELDHIRPSDPFSSTTPELPVLEPPSGAQHSTPSTETERNKRVLPFPNLEGSSKKPEPETPRQLNSFNSGYFIPSLTSLGSSKPENLVAQGSMNPSDQSNFSWNNGPQDPENTFHPNLDKFMRPPGGSNNGINVASANEQSSSHLEVPSSAVWVKAPSLHSSVGDKNHPFSGFNSEVNLQHAASGDHDHMGNEEHYTHNDGGGGGYEYNSPPGEDPNFHYTHSIKSHGPPPTYIIQGHPPPSSSVLISQSNEKPHTSSNHQYKNSNDGQSNNQKENYSHKNQGNNGNQQNSPSKHPENNPGGHYGWGYDDSMWSKAKAYFNKGKKTTAEKVFEISLAVLSFLAFGGYLLMLIYQVFAVSSVVPLFPLLSSTVPQNPTILGVLLGRSSDQGYGFTYPGEKIGEDYINQLETIVKGAMDRVKITLSSTDGNDVQVKGDLGH